MVKRLADGSLFVGLVEEEIPKNEPITDEPKIEVEEQLEGQTSLDDYLASAEKPKNKGGRPRKK